MEHKDSVIIYESTFTAMELILTDASSWKEAMIGLLRYGFYGEQPESGNPLVQAIWIQSLPAMKNAKERYTKAIANGKKGGRPPQVTTEQIMQLKEEGKTNKEIAMICGCSEKTIESHITTFNKENQNQTTESDTYSDTYTYSESDTDTERFQGFIGFQGCAEQETKIDFSLDIIDTVISMYKQGKNYDAIKEKVKQNFNQHISGKQIHCIIDNRDKYEDEIEKDKKAKADAVYQQVLINTQKKHDTELIRAGEVVRTFKKYGVNVSEEQVRKRYTTDIIGGECGCCVWSMDNLTQFIEQWPSAYQGLEGYHALNEVIRDIERSCMYGSYDHMSSKVSQKLTTQIPNDDYELLNIYDEEF